MRDFEYHTSEHSTIQLDILYLTYIATILDLVGLYPNQAIPL